MRQCRIVDCMEIVRTRVYERKISKLLDEAELLVAENNIVADPEKWPVISGTGGIRKARAARGSSGKSSGVRIIYYFWVSEAKIYFLDVYPKSEKENLSGAEKNSLKSLITEMTEGTNHAKNT